MREEDELIKKRFLELSAQAQRGGYFTFTDFLGLPEQSAFAEIKQKLHYGSYKLFGGAQGAERTVIRFGDEEEIGYDCDFPIVCIKAEPKSQKFADKLTHRDFLGALLNLGIERSVLGDIVINNNIGYIFAKEEIAEYIITTLSKVKHTDVTLSIASDIPEGELFRTEARRIQANSERADAVIAKVFCLSRDDSQSLFKKKLVYIDGRLCESPSYQPKSGEKISVRGYGKMIYRGFDSLSKKGKLNITVDLYV